MSESWVGRADKPDAAVVLTPAAAQAPAANTAAVATLGAPTDGTCWTIGQIPWSYSADPTGGSLTIAWGGSSETYAITKGGPGFLPFGPAKRFPPNTQVTVTLAAGGNGVTGTVYPNAWTER